MNEMSSSELAKNSSELARLRSSFLPVVGSLGGSQSGAGALKLASYLIIVL